MLGTGTLFDAVLGLAVLLFSVVIHENAHGVTALALGDDTARRAGRLTLNPVRHLDLVGSVIVPVALFFSVGTMFGYAKPVPVTPSRLRGTDRTGFAIVAGAGPLSNLVLVFVAATALQSMDLVPGSVTYRTLVFLFQWNLILAAFNLLPIPPLDGSRFLRLFLTQSGRQTLDRLEPFGFLILFLLIFVLGEPLFRVIRIIQDLLLRLLPL